jgi:Bacterial Ig-like domain (group 3)/MBG domain (YGX type)/Dockerin type I domain
VYVSGGALTLTNDTIAADSAQAGSSASGGKGGHAGTGDLTGGLGIAGAPGDSFGGGLYVSGGAVNLFNTTVALNLQNGDGEGGGVVQAAGKVNAVSTLFAGNGPVDYSGDIDATDSLFQTQPIDGTLSGSGNLTQVDPLLDPNGLQNNGGPTLTIALQALSPAIDAGANPEHLLTDQRGAAPRTGPQGTDIGAYQDNAPADTQVPTAALQAVAVTDANAASLNPYDFTVTFADNVAIAAARLPDAVVEVVPPGEAAPVSATVVSTTPVGTTDANGNAKSFVVQYQITPPGGSWTSEDNGTYSITLGGAPVTDLAGNAVVSGNLGTFSVLLDAGTHTATVMVASTLAGSTYGQSVSFTVVVSGAVGTPQGTVQFVVDGTNFGSPVSLSGGDASSPSTKLLGAGSHTIQAQYSGDSNYAANFGTYTQVVNHAPLSIVPDNQSRPVGHANPTLTYQFTGFVNGDTAGSSGITGSADLATTATTSSPAGKYPITVTNAGNLAAPNYNFPSADFGSATLTVTPGAATVVAGSTLPGSTYGQSVSFTVVVSGGGPTPGGTVQFVVDGTNVGSPVSLSGGDATSASTKLLGAGSHTIQAQYSGDSNYAANSGTYTQVVNQAPLSIVPDNQSRPVGQANPMLTYQFTGFVNGDTAVSSSITGSADLATTATTSSPAGKYPITVTDAGTLAAPNYKFPSGDFGTGTLTVTPPVPTVVVGSTLPGSTYGQSVSFTVVVSGGAGTPQGTVQFVVDGTNFGSPVALSGGDATSASTTALGAGSHAIQAQYSGDSNYAANSGSFTQAVNQAELTLVADDKQMNHYDAVPALAYHYTGFVNGDNATSSGINASVSLSTTATSTSPAGYYPIHPTVDSFSAPNYAVGGTQDGTLTVKPKVMKLTVDFRTTSMSLIGLNRDLPFINIKAIDVIFSDNVNVSKSMLQLLGVKVPNYSFRKFTYNSSTFDATWTVPSAIGIDHLMLSVSGEVAPPVSGSGPPIAADAFSNKFAVLPGDVNGDNVVSARDLAVVRTEIRTHKYLIWADVDGNRVVNQTDYNEVKKRLGSQFTASTKTVRTTRRQGSKAIVSRGTIGA